MQEFLQKEFLILMFCSFVVTFSIHLSPHHRCSSTVCSAAEDIAPWPPPPASWKRSLFSPVSQEKLFLVTAQVIHKSPWYVAKYALPFICFWQVGASISMCVMISIPCGIFNFPFHRKRITGWELGGPGLWRRKDGLKWTGVARRDWLGSVASIFLTFSEARQSLRVRKWELNWGPGRRVV